MMRTHSRLTRGGFVRHVLSSRRFWAIAATIGVLGMGSATFFFRAGSGSPESAPPRAVDPDTTLAVDPHATLAVDLDTTLAVDPHATLFVDPDPTLAEDPDATLDELAKPSDTYAAMSYSKKIREMMAAKDEAGETYSDELIDLIENFFRHGHQDLQVLEEEGITFLEDRTRTTIVSDVVTRRYARDWVLILFNNVFPPDEDLIPAEQSDARDTESDDTSFTNRDKLRRMFVRLASDVEVTDLETARRWKLFFRLADRILTSEIDGVDTAIENLDQVAKTLRRVATSWRPDDLSQIEDSVQRLTHRVFQVEE